MRKRVIIIGGGASGLAAAVCCAREGAHAVVIEHMDRVGKKLLSTGNGRCNLTNQNMGPDCYRSEEPGFPMAVIRGFGVEETLDFFRSLGVEPKSRNGYIYPNSDQAGAVLDALRQEIAHRGVQVLTGIHALEIREASRNGEKGFAVVTDQGEMEAGAVILAAGSKAAPATGSDGSGYELARALGHGIIKPLPALVQLRCQGRHYRELAGIRTEAMVRLFGDGELLAQDRGELQLTDYGLSGIPIFQVSRFASVALDERKRVEAQVDFLPAWSRRETVPLLKARRQQLAYREGGEFLTGLLNKKLAQVLLKGAGIPLNGLSGQITDRQLELLSRQIHCYEALVMSVNPFANAQVCRGGVDTRQVDPKTMESRICPGFYLCGEILDVDGICGGYNLQFAWSSGILAARSAAARVRAMKGQDGEEEAGEDAAVPVPVQPPASAQRGGRTAGRANPPSRRPKGQSRPCPLGGRGMPERGHRVQNGPGKVYKSRRNKG